MKTIKLLFSFLLVGAMQAFAQESLPKVNLWIFNYADNWYQQNDSILCQNIYQWNYSCYEYDKELNGKKYEIFFSEPEVAPTTGARKASEAADRLYALLIRRADGRVYADYQDYLAYISQDWEHWGRSYADTNYIPYQLTDDGEIILYDYNMEVGEKYRSVEGYDDISVASKDEVTLEDGKPRRRLTLSNGLILIEGIGCINSNGMLLDYLNPAGKYANRFSYLDKAYSMDTKVYSNTIFKVGNAHPDGIDPLHLSPITQHPSALYDLQGRKVQGQPTRGIYIKDGKKVVIK